MLRFVDSFSHYTQAFMEEKWDVCEFGTGAWTMVQGLTSGRFGGGGVTFTANPADTNTVALQYMQKNWAGGSTVIVGMAIKQTTTQVLGHDLNAFGGGGRWLSFLDGSTLQVALSILQSGQIQAIRNTAANQGWINSATCSNGTVLGISTAAVSSSSYDFLEVKVVHHPSTGSIEIKRNGLAFWTLSNVNTAISGSNNSSSVIVGGFNGQFCGGEFQAHPLQAIVSDFHLLDTVANGSDPNDPVDFIGDRHWEVVRPTTDSTPLDWTITGSASHFANVDEIPPNTTDYNSTDTVNDEDALLFATLTGPSSASVLLSYTMYLQKDTGGAVGVSGLMVSPAGGGGTHGNGTEFQVPNPYAFRQSFLCTDPAAPGTNPLTVAIVNAAGNGYERTS